MCQNEVVMPKSAYPMFKANFAQDMLFGSCKDMFYFSGIVKAEMKKNISYRTLLTISLSLLTCLLLCNMGHMSALRVLVCRHIVSIFGCCCSFWNIL